MDHFFTRHAVDVQSPGCRTRLASALTIHGVATFTGLAKRAKALRVAGEVLTLVSHRDAEADGVTVIRDLGGIAARPGCAGFGHQELYPHTEGTTLVRPPAAMMLVCARPAVSGGESLLVDAAAVHSALLAVDADLAAALGEPRSALFGGGAGHLGAVFSPGKAGRVVVRFRGDDLVRFHPRIACKLHVLRQVIEQRSVRLRLQHGDGFLISNTRWLHARTAFTGPRIMYRILGAPLPELNIPSGFTPTRSAEYTTAS